MISVCLYFQVHQPFRLSRDYNFFKLGQDHRYVDADLNRSIIRNVADNCYLPANEILLNAIQKHDGRFRVGFSITGTALEQFRMYAPEVIRSFQRLVKTGCVELINETYYHSLAFLYSREEFRRQVRAHQDLLKELFDYTPTCFRNTELIYSNDLAAEVAELGHKVVLAEGANQILGWRTPNFVYEPVNTDNVKLLLKNYRLSDDLAFRFTNKHWSGYPLTPVKYANSINALAGDSDVVSLFMDYETFGEHHPAESGIMEFLGEMPDAVLQLPDSCFQTPSEVAGALVPTAKIDVPFYISWADVERDLTAWTGNPLQDSALEQLYAMQQAVIDSGDEELLLAWRRLQTSDHFYYMCTKWSSDGDVHKYFNPFASPHDAYVVYVNVLNDIRERLRRGTVPDAAVKE